MITDFKLYEKNEKNDDSPQIGDYVICSGSIAPEEAFVFNKIGQIIGFDNSQSSTYPYRVTYDNIPRNIVNDIIDGKSVIFMNNGSILYWSKDKEYLELIINTNKFNI